jgi:hypothetical protein
LRSTASRPEEMRHRPSPLSALIGLHITAVRPGGNGELTELLERFDALDQGDLYARQPAVFLAENAIAANKPGAVLDRIDVLRSIAFEAA